MNQIEKVLSVASKYVGVKEDPPGSNCVLFNTKFYGKPVSGSNYAWCSTAVGYWFWEAGLIELTSFYNKGDDYKYNAKNIALAHNWVSAAKKLGQWVTGGYQRGDVVLFDWDGNGVANHIGIVENVLQEKTPGGKITLDTIEGNSSDMVKRCSHIVDKTVLGAFRPKYELTTAGNPSASADMKAKVAAALDKLAKAGVIDSPDYWLKNYNELLYLDQFIVKVAGALK